MTYSSNLFFNQHSFAWGAFKGCFKCLLEIVCVNIYKDPFTPLLIDIVRAVAGKRSHHGYAMGSQKVAQILLTGFRQDREIASINQLDPK